jgi:5S rRNA maturation endonuclease (ribonuclease M5)
MPHYLERIPGGFFRDENLPPLKNNESIDGCNSIEIDDYKSSEQEPLIPMKTEKIKIKFEYLDVRKINCFIDLIDSGFAKLWMIRKMSIHYRHLLKAYMHGKINDNELEYLESRKNPIIKNIFYMYHKAIEALHKMSREMKNIRYIILFDFDHTLTNIVRKFRNETINYINEQIIAKIRLTLGKEFFDIIYKDYKIQNNIDYYLLTASGNVDGINNYLENNKLDKMFPAHKRFICGGNYNKIKTLQEIVRKQRKDRIHFMVDDDMKMLRYGGLCFVIPIWIDKKCRLKLRTEALVD